MSYQYTALNQAKREVRLIILDGGPGAGTPAHLKCKLLPVSLDLYTRYQSSIGGDGDTVWQSIGRVLTSKNAFPTPFYALSYVWGDPKPVCDIEIDGQLTKIPQNLGDALLSIRDNTKLTTQKNPGSHLALKALEDLAECLKSTHWKQNWSKEITTMSPKLNEVALAISRDMFRWAAIVALTARPYWSRVWIFQEMACSRKNLYLCGNLQAQDLKYPLYFLMWWGRQAFEFSAPPLHPQCVAMISTLYRYEHTLLGEALFRYRPPRLASLLANLGALDATDSRDRVFAVLSMAEDGRWSGIMPDYSKTETAVLIETACALLRLNWIGEIIACAATSDHPPGLPSWVPQWSALKGSAFSAGVYDVCKGKEQHKSTLMSIPTHALQIQLDGYVVGMISITAESFWEFAFQKNGVAASPSTSLRPWLQSVEAIVSPDDGDNVDQMNISNHPSSSSKTIDVMAQLLVADTIGHPKKQRLGPGASGFYKYVKGVDPVYVSKKLKIYKQHPEVHQ